VKPKRMSAILINPFEVAEGKEAEALACWERAADSIEASVAFLN
jgi:hypothetical protein